MNFETQMKLQQIAGAKQQIAHGIIQKKMAEEKFPSHLLDPLWIEQMRVAIRHCSPMSQKATLKEFKSTMQHLNDENVQLTLTEFQIIANCLDVVSPQQLGLNDHEYYALVEATFKLVDAWATKIKKVNEDAMIQAEQEYKMKQATAGAVEVKGAFKPVKAEA